MNKGLKFMWGIHRVFDAGPRINVPFGPVAEPKIF